MRLLAAIQKGEAEQKRGRLKVFFGMAAGVGKTYAMLEAAIKKQREGVEVLLGYVETHGRKDTESLANQLPLLPRKRLRYREMDVEEFDLDAALARHPDSSWSMSWLTPMFPARGIRNATRIWSNCWKLESMFTPR